MRLRMSVNSSCRGVVRVVDEVKPCILAYARPQNPPRRLLFPSAGREGSSGLPGTIMPCRGISSSTSRQSNSAARNTVINFVPHQEAWIVERMGRFSKILNPGINVLVPVIDKIPYVQSLKEQAIEIPHQSAITVDNVMLTIDGILYVKVFDPYKASYGVEDVEFAIKQLAQTTMRSEVGKINLDTVFKERERLNEAIVHAINRASDPWGVSCMRYEIRDMKMPEKIQEAMQMQVEAERRKRAAVLESEGVREAEINKAEGKRKATILLSEAAKMEQINRAQGEADAIMFRANARAAAIQKIASSLENNEGTNAASLAIAEQYVSAFANLAKSSNTLIVPANASEASSMVAQALTVYQSLTDKKQAAQESGAPATEKSQQQKRNNRREETHDLSTS